MKKAIDPRITPLMEPYLKSTDTKEIINKAFEIAEEHAFVKCESIGTPARFHTYLKESEIDPKIGAYLVPKGSVFETFRFGQAIKAARNLKTS
jgi:hypothetical protein